MADLVMTLGLRPPGAWCRSCGFWRPLNELLVVTSPATGAELHHVCRPAVAGAACMRRGVGVAAVHSIAPADPVAFDQARRNALERSVAERRYLEDRRVRWSAGVGEDRQ